MNFDLYAVKLFIEHATGVSMDAMHVIVGVLLHLIFAAVLRSSLARPLPLLLVLAVALLNEANDMRRELWTVLSMQLGEGAKDIALTMFLPLLFFLVARLRPKLLSR